MRYKYYNQYFNETEEKATEVKKNIIRNLVKDYKVYKFISFGEDVENNLRKIETIKEKKLWFSFYPYLNDDSEFEIKYDINRIAKKLNNQKKLAEEFIKSVKNMYDICSFTYESNSSMWKNYANGGNGLCMVYKINNLDNFFPIEYMDKKDIDFTEMIINFIEIQRKYGNHYLYKHPHPLTIVPFVAKNPKNGKLISTDEKELRILYSHDDNLLFKKGSDYRGVTRPYSDKDIDLGVEEIIIGKKCNELIQKEIVDICHIHNYKYQI